MLCYAFIFLFDLCNQNKKITLAFVVSVEQKKFNAGSKHIRMLYLQRSRNTTVKCKGSINIDYVHVYKR